MMPRFSTVLMREGFNRRLLIVVPLLVAVIGAAVTLTLTDYVLGGGPAAPLAGVFDSGSTGVDGALDYTGTPAGTIIEFDPDDPAQFDPPLDQDGDGIYNFTTITIPADVTIRLTARHLAGPAFWLASGAVQIDGIIDLSGEDGNHRTSFTAESVVSVPGAGGYGGGIGGIGGNAAQPGNGPGGGAIDLGGSHTGNSFLVPLFGGSGGGGHTRQGDGVGGGAGGGALLIASSASIGVDGLIATHGGFGGRGATGTGGFLAGSGSSGAIRLVAPVITGTGTLASPTIHSSTGTGGPGFVRLEAFDHAFTGHSDPVAIRRSPVGLFLPPNPPPSVRFVSMEGISLPEIPDDSFETPDVTIDQTGEATVELEAHNIPLGTVVRVHVISEEGLDQFVDSTPLAGTFELSTATVMVTMPPGHSRFLVKTTWDP